MGKEAVVGDYREDKRRLRGRGWGEAGLGVDNLAQVKPPRGNPERPCRCHGRRLGHPGHGGEEAPALGQAPRPPRGVRAAATL